MRSMIRPPKRFKGSLEIWLADLAAERATFKTALRAGCRWLTFICPGCQQVGEVDLVQFDFHPHAPITALIPKLSCTRCCPNPPHARLLRLTRHLAMTEIVKRKPNRRG